MARTETWLYRSANTALLYIYLWCGCLLGCSSPNHGALSDQALADAHAAYEKQDFMRATQLLKLAAKEADLSDEAVHKNRVLREQIAVALAANNPQQAEESARELVKYEQEQEPAGKSSLTSHMEWAEDMARAEMLLGDALRAENRVTEALAAYNAARDSAKETPSTALEVSISEHYMQALKALGGETKSAANADIGAAGGAFETYGDLRNEMRYYRTHKVWDKLSATAENCAESAIPCKQYSNAVVAYNLGALAEYILGHPEKARDLAQKAISLAKQHPDDKSACASSAGAWFFLAITDQSPTQAKQDALKAYSTNWQQVEECRRKTLESLDDARRNKVNDWWNELRVCSTHQYDAYTRRLLWSIWVQDMIRHQKISEERLYDGCAWADKLYARKKIDMQDLADCNDAIWGAKTSGDSQKTQQFRRSRVQQAVPLREELRRQSPGDQYNLGFLACEYEAIGQIAKARELAQTTLRGINKNDPLHPFLDSLIKRCNTDLKPK